MSFKQIIIGKFTKSMTEFDNKPIKSNIWVVYVCFDLGSQIE